MIITDEMVETAAKAIARAIDLDWDNAGGRMEGYVKEQAREALKAALPLIEASKWRPIETAPKDGRIVLFYFPSCDCEIAEVYWFICKEPPESENFWEGFTYKSETVAGTNFEVAMEFATHWCEFIKPKGAA